MLSTTFLGITHIISCNCTCVLMFLMTSQGELVVASRAGLPERHSAKVGSGLMAAFCASEDLISSWAQVLLPELNDGVVAKGFALSPLCSLGVFMYGGAEGSEVTDKPGGLEGAEEKVSGCEVWFQILLTSSFPHWFCWRGMEGSSGVPRGVDPHTGLDKPGVMGAPGVIPSAPQLLSEDELLSNSSRVPRGVPMPLELFSPFPLGLGAKLVGGAMRRPAGGCCLGGFHDAGPSPIPADPGGNWEDVAMDTGDTAVCPAPRLG